MTAATSQDGAACQTAAPVLLSVAFPYAPIGPRAVGGAEVICSQLEAALPQLGFRSVVVAHMDSSPAGKLYPTAIPDGVITDALRAHVEAAHQANIDRALRENPVALVHMHGLDFDRYRIPAHIPVIVTLHLPAAWYPECIWTSPDNVHLLCVSESQRRSCPAHAQHRLTVIENGVPLPDPATLRPSGRYALMLARICPEKNLHVGFDAARLAGMPAILAGETFPYQAHLRYLDDEIKPRLTAAAATHEARGNAIPEAPGARFLGPVAGHEKQRLLARAACLLLPSLAPETSSLVAMEALAAGIPVVGLTVGAVPEIVEHGRTGLLVSPEGDVTSHLSEALRQVPTLDRKLCRAAAEERFPLNRMIGAYAQLYRRLADPVPIAIPSSQTNPTLSSPSIPSDTALAGNAVERSSPCSPLTLIATALQTSEDLEALLPEWTDLYGRDATATPFQHPAWLLPWWRQFGPEGILQGLALRDRSSQQLLGLLPSYTYASPETGGRQLLLLGAGTTDYLGGLWSPQAQHAPGLALEHVLRPSQAWDHVSLHQLRQDSLLLKAAKAASLPLGHAESCSTISMANDLPAKMRGNLARYRRLAGARGELDCHLAANSVEALTIFEELVRLHSNRWEGRGKEGVLHDPRVLAHHRESLPLLNKAGLLRLFHLTLNGETMGVLYGLADAPHAADRRLYLYLIGFDVRFAPLSPGSLLVHAAWEHAREHGFAKVDLLRGGESYKQLWGARPEPTHAIQIDRNPA